MMAPKLLTLVLLVVVALAACGGDSPDSGGEGDATSRPEATEARNSGQKATTAVTPAFEDNVDGAEAAEESKYTPEPTPQGVLGRVSGTGSQATTGPEATEESSGAMSRLSSDGGRVKSNSTSISAGWDHTCEVKTDGTVACWGSDRQGQATPPEGYFASVSVRRGWYRGHTCGVRTDGAVVCWGNDTHGHATPPKGEFASVSAGEEHTCGVRTDWTVACWGELAREVTAADWE